MSKKTDSPCRHECLYDNRLGFCVSCGRTMQEVSQWTRMSDWKRQDVNRKAKERLEMVDD